MKAILFYEHGNVDVLEYADFPTPEPGPGQVLVKIAASPINPSDVAFIHGTYGFRSPPPVVPGQEGAGTVVAAGLPAWVAQLALPVGFALIASTESHGRLRPGDSPLVAHVLRKSLIRGHG